MKSRVSIAVSLVLILAAADVFACGISYYPSQYHIYKSRDHFKDWSDPLKWIPMTRFDRNVGAMENCILWQKQTTSEATLEEIYDIVYTADIAELEELGRGDDIFGKDNKFAEYLKYHDDARNFLILAKQCESARREMVSPWYYPSRKNIDDGYTQSEPSFLDQIVLKCRKEMAVNPKYHDRYCLQAIRALYSSERYRECVDMWTGSKMQEGILKKLAAGYIGGACEHLGDMDKALKMYVVADDMYEVRRLCSAMCMDLPDTPYCPSFRESVEEPIYKAEACYWGTDSYSGSGIEKEIEDYVLPICLKFGKDKSVPDRRFYLYSAAYSYFLLGDIRQAEKYNALAMSTPGEIFIGEYAKILQFWIDSGKPYSPSYENKMLGYIQFLERLMRSCLEESVQTYRKEEYSIIDPLDLLSCTKLGYYNKMILKAVQTNICPTLLKKGKYSSAIAFANISDYLMVNMLDGNNEYETSLSDYRKRIAHVTVFNDTTRHNLLWRECNWLDFGNYSFNMMDTVGVDNLIAYANSLDRNNTTLIRYVNAKGFTDRNYLNDMIGTQLIRALRYGEASRYLEKVPAAYQLSLNTNVYLRRDPFATEKTELPVSFDVKYNFASTMEDLEKRIKNSKDPDRKALYLVKYATGMRNCFGDCWALAFYGLSECDSEKGTPFRKAQDLAFSKAEKLYAQALEICSDADVRAGIHYAMRNIATLKRSEFQGTQFGNFVSIHCDKWADYHLEKSGNHWQPGYLLGCSNTYFNGQGNDR